MDWCCSRCGHRQAEEKACGGCGAESVQDVRSRAGRALLEETEGRIVEERSSRAVKVAAVAGVSTVVVLTALGGGLLLNIPIGMAIGAAAWPTANKALAKPPRFPFLGSLPPADRP